jgi:hypothetical protein
MPEHSPDSVLTLAGGVLGTTPLVCPHCGSSFIPRRRRRDVRFCRPACRARWHAKRRAAMLAELEQSLDRAAALVRELRARRER